MTNFNLINYFISFILCSCAYPSPDDDILLLNYDLKVFLPPSINQGPSVVFSHGKLA